ncbi:haloacid dehalogenase-like hydrolase [Colletotrichum truncatum]|uniref:Haloacid dehalogenase-like hydrolase n=1 Tax=Colletotrichum truncatum TaxID=5467 RepID=A0ACC3ZKT2_COLTU|nr:haloacid dehalogenase-like hydrolase [Colletotrichum truncatum]KAF6800078.1 haloacid dehalogenase-like hydrolase [Colletotrichum truncatum]
MAPRTDFPPVRACLFDMDGLLLDTEDLYTACINTILEQQGRPLLPWSIKAKLQGRPGPDATRLFHEWAQLSLSHEEYQKQLSALQRQIFPTTQPLPGVPELLANLGRTRYWDLKPAAADAADKQNPHRVHIALATSSHEANFKLKSDHLTELFSVFPTQRRVLGDDKRIAPGRGKPNPDIFLLALKTINDSLPAGEKPITPEECLVFEDSVPGVEAGRRAGMRVIWSPHKMLLNEYKGREKEVLAGRTGEAGQVDMHQVGEIDDGWAEYLPNLVNFPYEKFGMTIPPVEVDNEPFMKENVGDVVVGKTNGTA